MPQLQVTTKSATQVWASPDGQRKIFELQLDYQGKPVTASTYSDAIATVGWTGTVETYEKEGKYGSQTFVKQPPKEGGFQSQQGSHPGSTGGRSSKSFSTDPFTMYLSYAKDLAVASVHEGKFDTKLYVDLLDAVSAGGVQLYAGRPDAPAQPETKDVVHNPDEVSMEDLSAVLGDVTNISEEETPWPNKAS